MADNNPNYQQESVKDYILFIHGVNNRSEPNRPDYAEKIFNSIQTEVERLKVPSLEINLKEAPLYWGEVAQKAQKDLHQDLERSEKFNEYFWFKDFRKKELLQFAGDIAIYFDPDANARIISKLKENAQEFLKNYKKGDRLHLVTHSWGTVILFDILFSYRWDSRYEHHLPGYEDVETIRQSLRGTAPNKNEGFYLSSIHTMGSPIALYILVLLNNKTSKLSELSEYFRQQNSNKRQKLLWQNFVHPGDPIALPLEETISRFMHELRIHDTLDVHDIVISPTGIINSVLKLFSQKPFASFNGSDAHSSYWNSQKVSKTIAESIVNIAKKQATHSSQNTKSEIELGKLL